MRLRDLRDMIINREPLISCRIGEPYEVIPYDFTQYRGRVAIHCTSPDGGFDTIIMHLTPSPSNDPLDAELR
jgi:hypothetical protein